jgi:hypothetical protein
MRRHSREKLDELAERKSDVLRILSKWSSEKTTNGSEVKNSETSTSSMGNIEGGSPTLGVVPRLFLLNFLSLFVFFRILPSWTTAGRFDANSFGNQSFSSHKKVLPGMPLIVLRNPFSGFLKIIHLFY